LYFLVYFVEHISVHFTHSISEEEWAAMLQSVARRAAFPPEVQDQRDLEVNYFDGRTKRHSNGSNK